jgi:ribosomal protein S18 acetylase RimI-like enzyme
MTKRTRTIVRPFSGSLADAQGILAVERATFNECPYSTEKVRTMLTEGPQRAWLALAGDETAGFVITFATSGLRDSWWEIDLLAVHPTWRGHGLATRLIRAAAAYGAGVACRARAAIAADNTASARAFARTGFRTGSGMYRLLIYRTQSNTPLPRPARDVSVWQAASLSEASDWLGDPSLASSCTDCSPPGLALLLAERGGQPGGYAELIEVQTLLYRGVWIESLSARERVVRQALVREAVHRAQAAGMDEIGAMVPESDWLQQQALFAAGFRSLGDFHWLTADLPLPGLAEEDHV